MLLDLGPVEEEHFFGEFVLKFQDGRLCLIEKKESYKPQLAAETNLVVILDRRK